MKRIKKIVAAMLVVTLTVENPQLVKADTFYRDIPENVLEMNSLFGAEITMQDDGFEFNLYYQLNGGTNSILNPSQYDITQLPITLMVPTKSGYDFGGWYTDPGYKNKITEITERNCDNLILYAKWSRSIDAVRTVNTYGYSTDRFFSGNAKRLSNCRYSFVSDIEIPGMPSTREMDRISNKICGDEQCPQGICFAEDYILVSSYCTDWGKAGSLHVFNKATGEYLVTLGMKSSSHLGGVAYDGANVWVCHSDNQSLERISYRFIKLLADRKLKKTVDCTESVMEYPVENRPSCVSFYNGHLWVATQTNFFKSVMMSYVYEDGELVADGSYNIPDKVQGVAFGNDGRVYLSTSLGRTKSSYIKIYPSINELDSAPSRPMQKIEMPPCSEEIDINDGKIYVVFESAGMKYLEGTDGKGRSDSPIDEILTIEIASL